MINQLLSSIGRFVRDEDGTTAVEYAVMLAMIIIIMIGTILNAGELQQAMFSDTRDDLNQSLFPSN